VQNYTSYDAALMSGAGAPDAAAAVLRQLATPAAKAAFAAAGIEWRGADFIESAAPGGASAQR